MVFNRDMLDHRIIDNINICDNFLDIDFFNDFKNLMFRTEFPWYISTVLPEDYGETCPDRLAKPLMLSICDPKYNLQLVHMYYSDNCPNSKYYEKYILPILKKLKVKSLIRVKANLNPRTEKNIRGGFHVDSWDETFTSILYFNNCNGYTEFMNGPKVKNIENRLITFPSSYYHSGVTCTDDKARIVLNLNYYS